MDVFCGGRDVGGAGEAVVVAVGMTMGEAVSVGDAVSIGAGDTDAVAGRTNFAVAIAEPDSGLQPANKINRRDS